jgi:hypothetical protein
MICRVACTLASRIPFLRAVTMPPGSRSNMPLSVSACRHTRMRRLMIILLPLTLLTSGAARSQSTVSLFTNVVPATPANKNGSPTTLGLKFWSAEVGTISAIQFYRAVASPQGYVASLYSADGSTLLGSVTMPTESGPVPGWQQAVFATPISIKANTTYVAAYYAPNGRYSDTPSGLTNTVTSGTLNAPAAALVGGNGVLFNGKGFPTTPWENANFFVDVAFTSTAPFLSIALNPPSPTIPSTTPLGAVVATVTVTWSNGAPFTGTLSFGPPNSNGGGVYALSGNNLIVSPSGPGVGPAGGSVQNVTIIATQ